MARFLTQLSVRREDHRDTGKWLLNQPLAYESDLPGVGRIEVPEDFPTDFASVPRWILIYWLVGNEGDSAATLHDWIYSTHLYSRETADMVLREALRVSFVARWRIPLFYWGVRLFGWSHWR